MKLLRNYCHVLKRFTLPAQCGVRYKHSSLRPAPPPYPLKPVDETERLSDYFNALRVIDPEVDAEVNIGLPWPHQFVLSRRVQKEWTKSRGILEQAARLRQLTLSLSDVHETWLKESAFTHIRTIADHYGIYRDLFNSGFFYPCVNLEIGYDYDDDTVTPVYTGNKIPAQDVLSAPRVMYDASPDTLWTLLLTNPDGHLQDNEAEYLHWLVGNIHSNDISTGEVIADYLSPFPAKGTGFHRFVFVLYKQEGHIDYSNLLQPKHSVSLTSRTFNNCEFYREREDVLTPAGLAFFQSEWDESVINTFRNTLGMKEPTFEFHHPPPYHPLQLTYPHKEPFNLYLDRYRDIKDIREEVFLERLKNMKPFEEPEPPLKYPNIFHLPFSVPTWLKRKIWMKRLREFQWKEL